MVSKSTTNKRRAAALKGWETRRRKQFNITDDNFSVGSGKPLNSKL